MVSIYDGMGWCGVSFHGNNKQIKLITQAIIDGIEQENNNINQIVSRYVENVFHINR